ncbi:DUF5333 domain-containing protein [Seohaeicola zhoushanensis]|nr:DUF5333 domain-containing protein [Seohaeicola zhoushanensis]
MTLKTIAFALAMTLALPGYAAAARPALRDVPSIEDALFAVAIADAVRDNCGSINARLIRALSFLRQIKAEANALGYSDDEIRAYVESDTEKARMKKKGKAFLAANGVTPDKPETFCTFGRAEIAKNSAIGALLRAN